MTTTRHYTAEQWSSYLDGQLAEDERVRMQNHMSDCRDCGQVFRALSHIDTVLHDLPLAETRPDFTRSLMDRILAKKSSPLAFRLLEKLPYALGLALVLGIMIGSFVITGVVDRSQLDQTKGVATGLVDRAGETLSASISAFTTWLVQYLPFAFGKGSFGVAFFAVGVVAMLAAIDRMVARKVVQK